MSLEEESVYHVISGSNGVLGLTILLASIRTRVVKENSMLAKKGDVEGVIKLASVMCLT